MAVTAQGSLIHIGWSSSSLVVTALLNLVEPAGGTATGGGGGMSGGAVAGAVLGSLAGVAVLGGLA
jgi:hypothetical protein